MKPKSIAGVQYAVRDIGVTAAFYESLGLRVGERSDKSLRLYVNWFWVEFYKDNAKKRTSASVAYPRLCYCIDDIDAFYEYVLSLGIRATTEPCPLSLGKREFILTDPDGYQIVFFSKK